MNGLKFVNSDDTFPTELDLFQTPPTNTTCEKINFINYRPHGQLLDGSPLVFTIPNGGTQYMDLKRTFLKLKFKITKGNNENVTLDDSVASINLPLHCMFSRVEVYFNQKLVSGGGVFYPYKAYLETLLDYGREAKETQLLSVGFHKDTAVFMESFDNKNDGFFARQLQTVNGKVWQLEGPLMSDICQQERYILNNVEITFKLYPSTSEFFILSGKNIPGLKYQITDVFLQVAMITPTPWILVAHKQALDRGNAIFPYLRTDIKTLSVTRGEYGFTIEDVYQGMIPKELVIAMVTSKSLNGTYDSNPLNLIHCNINSLTVIIDGSPCPTEPLSLNIRNNEVLDGYNTLFRGLDKDSKDVGCDISMHEWVHGFSVFIFNLLPGDYLPLIRKANVRIEGRFSNPLSENINVILLAKFPSTLEIDRERNIITR
jgi:hypothetical protein